MVYEFLFITINIFQAFDFEGNLKSRIGELENSIFYVTKTRGFGIFQIRFSWQLMLSVLLSKLIISTFEWIQKSSLVPRTNSHCLHLKTSTSPSPCELTFCTRIPWNNYKRKLISDLSFKSISTLHMFGLLNFYLVIIQILWN